jgi:hypothetical protein
MLASHCVNYRFRRFDMRWIGCLALGALVACGDEESKAQAEDTAVIPEGATPGDCSDGEDNDGDGLIDCDDDGCAGASACEEVPEDTGDSGEPWPVTLPPELEDYIDVTVIPDGDFTCMETGWVEDPATTAGEAVSTATVAKIHTGENLYPVRIEIFGGDDPTADVVNEPDGMDLNSGEWEGPLATCSPFSVRTSAERLLPGSRPTVSMHTVLGPGGGAETFQIVGEAAHGALNDMYAPLDPLSADTGVMFGRVLDCAGSPVRGAQVVLLDEEGMPLEEQQRFYTEGGTPTRDQLYTSEDGWWMAAKVPHGVWTVSVWVSDGAMDFIQVGEVPMYSLADDHPTAPAVVWTHANAHVGHLDGTVYPDSCAE